MKCIKNILSKYNVYISPHDRFNSVRNKLLNRSKTSDTLFINNLSDVIHKYNIWNQYFVRIRPFYSVKSNEDPAMISILKELGAGFDCASGYEIKKMLSLGVKTQDIIFVKELLTLI